MSPLPAPRSIPREKVIERLERLYTFLCEGGWHVHANTVAVAIDEIKGVSALADWLKEFAPKVRASASNNSFAMMEAVKDMLRFVQAVPVEEYAAWRTALNEGVVADDDWADLSSRLDRLHHRLEQDGNYTDANIVWRAHKALTAKAGA